MEMDIQHGDASDSFDSFDSFTSFYPSSGKIGPFILFYFLLPFIFVYLPHLTTMYY